MKYKIVDILHSGRKGLRNTPVDEYKYDGMIGTIIKLDCNHIEDCENLKPVKWTFMSAKSPYTWWETSAVIGLSVDADTNFRLETINTIYVLEAIYDDQLN